MRVAGACAFRRPVVLDDFITSAQVSQLEALYFMRGDVGSTLNYRRDGNGFFVHR